MGMILGMKLNEINISPLKMDWFRCISYWNSPFLRGYVSFWGCKIWKLIPFYHGDPVNNGVLEIDPNLCSKKDPHRFLGGDVTRFLKHQQCLVLCVFQHQNLIDRSMPHTSMFPKKSPRCYRHGHLWKALGATILSSQVLYRLLDWRI